MTYLAFASSVSYSVWLLEVGYFNKALLWFTVYTSWLGDITLVCQMELRALFDTSYVVWQQRQKSWENMKLGQISLSYLFLSFLPSLKQYEKWLLQCHAMWAQLLVNIPTLYLSFHKAYCFKTTSSKFQA